jgi:G3E family GTPase
VIDGRLPISVITGFLGAGKTTLLNALLHHPGMRQTAVIINEFGEIGIDHDLVERSREDVVEMQGGCLCCTVRGDLSRAVRGLNLRRIKGQVPDFARIVIETTGLADPAPILQTLMTDPVIEHDFRLEGVITVVDAVNGAATLDGQTEALKQAAVADRLILAKIDLAEGAAVAQLRERLRRLNPGARIVAARNGDVDPAELFDTGPYDPATKSAAVERWLAEDAYAGSTSEHESHAHEHGANDHGHSHAAGGHDPNRHGERIRAFCLRHRQPLASSAVSLFLDLLTEQRGADLLRVKGIVNLADTPERPLVIHAVQHVVHAPIELEAWPSNDHDTRLVFITRDIPREQVEQLWRALTSTEAHERS